LQYFAARYYDPETGRFTTKDPAPANIYDPQSLNRYTYCANDPINFVDPWGLCKTDDTEIERISNSGWNIGVICVGYGEDFYRTGGKTYRSREGGFVLGAGGDAHWDNNGFIINQSGLLGPGFSATSTILFYSIQAGWSYDQQTGYITHGPAFGLGVSAYATATEEVK
jgi:uncharacterized protein RhaS with RHS repeats